MSDRENGRQPGSGARVAPAAPEDLKESLDELARNVDSLVDRLTINMGDDPVEEPSPPQPDTPSVEAEPPAQPDKPRVAARPPTTPSAPFQMEDEDDVDADRLVDALMAETTESTPAHETIEPVATEAAAPETTVPESAGPAPENTATVPVGQVLREDDAVAQAESVGPEGVAAGEQPSVDVADDARAKEAVVPWSELESPPATGRFGGLWKLAAAACALGVVATVAWFMLRPDRTTTSSRTVDLSAPAREVGSATDPVAQLAFPALASTRNDDSALGDPPPAAAITGEPTDTTPSDDFTTAEIEDAPTPAPATRSIPAVVEVEQTLPVEPSPTVLPDAPAAVATERARPVEPAIAVTAPPTTTVEDRLPAATPPAPSKAPPEPVRTAASRPKRPTPEPRPLPAPVVETPTHTIPDTVERSTAAPDPAQPTRVASIVESSPPVSSTQLKPSPPLTTPPRIEPRNDPAVTTVAPTGAVAQIVPPSLLSRTEPVYPAGARGKSAIVELSVLVNERGRVVRVVVESGPPGSEFEARAIDAALRATYEPATQDGQPVRAWTKERFVFEP